MQSHIKSNWILMAGYWPWVTSSPFLDFCFCVQSACPPILPALFLLPAWSRWVQWPEPRAGTGDGAQVVEEGVIGGALSAHHGRCHGREISIVGAIPSISLPQQLPSWWPHRQTFLPFGFVLVAFPSNHSGALRPDTPVWIPVLPLTTGPLEMQLSDCRIIVLTSQGDIKLEM